MWDGRAGELAVEELDGLGVVDTGSTSRTVSPGTLTGKMVKSADCELEASNGRPAKAAVWLDISAGIVVIEAA